MRDHDGRTRLRQLVGLRTTLVPSAHARAQCGRLVCIALRGELQATRIRAALADCTV